MEDYAKTTFFFFLHVTGTKACISMNNYEFYSLGHMTDLYKILNWNSLQD